VYEDEGVSLVFCGANGREDALSYAQQRARHAPTEVKVLDAKWNVTKVIPAASRQSLI
jgi:hypothetical protein